MVAVRTPPGGSSPSDQLRHTQGEPVSDQDLFERFKRRAVEVLSVEDSQVKLEAKFADDLDADSLDLVEFVMALEEEFDINVEEQELEGVDTIGQAFELVKSKI
jgi:acyl carrier protein